MMDTLEREVIEKFHQLDQDAQQRVRELIGQPTHRTEPVGGGTFDYRAWFSDVESLRQEIRAGRGATFGTIDVVGLLRDLRDGEDE
ncbi:MAG: hypothetical protein EOM24_32450 [Chloroflexia bacterium]|nr:hypothetical protein [Chloroflexia bacterium]